jgi:hypothetical protein
MHASTRFGGGGLSHVLKEPHSLFNSICNRLHSTAQHNEQQGSISQCEQLAHSVQSGLSRDLYSSIKNVVVCAPSRALICCTSGAASVVNLAQAEHNLCAASFLPCEAGPCAVCCCERWCDSFVEALSE